MSSSSRAVSKSASVDALAANTRVADPRNDSANEPLVIPHVTFCTSNALWFASVVLGSSPGGHRRCVQSYLWATKKQQR